jgi:hypothetical protein
MQKNKGNAFERVTADNLTAIFEKKFFRTPGSGAYVGGKNFHRASELTNSQQLLLEGDIVVPEELANLKFECKTLKKFSFSSLLDNNSILDSWIEQAKSKEKLWFLVFKINNRGTFVVYDNEHFGGLRHTNDNFVVYKDVIIVKIDGFFEANKDNLLGYGSGDGLNFNDSTERCSTKL